MNRLLRLFAPVVLLGVPLAAAAALLNAPALAIPVRNMVVKANWNEFPPVGGSPFGAGYSACWSYVHGDGREYAIIGTTNYTAIYNVTNPDASYRVGLIPGPNSAWREMKSYRNWIYVVSEGSSPNPGVQIISMVNPESPFLVTTYTGGGTFIRSHSVSIDTTRALLFCNGTHSASAATGMRILSLANPTAPVEVGHWPYLTPPTDGSSYVHDCVPVGNLLYASSIYAGTQRFLDITDPATPTQIDEFSYDGAFYSHNSWPDKTGNYLYVTDEQNGQHLRTADVSNPHDVKIGFQYTPNAQAIVHNAVVKGDELFLANYTEGARVLDISDPAHPAEFGYADTYPATSGSYFGVWGICPMFPSGTVIASDMQSGLWVFRLTHDYGIVRVKVLDASNQQPLDAIHVGISGHAGAVPTDPAGIAVLAADPGSRSVQVNEFGWEPASAPVDVVTGERDTVTVLLTVKPRGNFLGTVRNASTQTLLDSVEVRLQGSPLFTKTDGSGQYAINQVPDDLYTVEAHRAGYAPIQFARWIGSAWSPQQDLQLQPATTYDAFEAASGWVVNGVSDNAVRGQWVNVVPIGTAGDPMLTSGTTMCVCGCGGRIGCCGASCGGGDEARAAGAMHSMAAMHSHDHAMGASMNATMTGATCQVDAAHGASLSAALRRGDGFDPTSQTPFATASVPYEFAPEAFAPGQAQPGNDHTPPPGTKCWVTGQGPGGAPPDSGDIDGGRTTLTSPIFNLSAMTDPAISVWRWFYSNGDSLDYLETLISNDGGTTWVSVDTLHGFKNSWTEKTIKVSSFVPPTSQVKVRFVAADNGPASVVEAAIDDITTYDAAAAVGVTPWRQPTALAFRAPKPNPTSGAVRLALEIPSARDVAVDVLDIAGRRVRTLHRGRALGGVLDMAWDGADESGRLVSPGLYFARARAGSEQSEVRVVRVQ